MSRRLFRLPPAALAALAFAMAGLLMLGVAFLAALIIENRSASVITARLAEARMDWVSVEADGLQVRLTGTAPNEAARFRALNLVGSLVDSSRLRDALDVTPTKALLAPRFSVEMLRNDDGIQLIGLMPEQAAEGGLTGPELVEAASALTPDDAVPTDMLQAAAWPAPEGWDEALRYGIEALGMLKRSKISVAADRIVITAIAASEAEKRRFLSQLNSRKPDGLAVTIDISAPRPVITPFTLRFVKDQDGARFDACSVDTPRGRIQILGAATAAGLEGTASCTIGLGSPSPRWAEGVSAAIRAVGVMGAGSVTFSDADITLLGGEGVSQADFDSAVGDLRAALPDVFSLNATLPKPEAVQQGPSEFTARLTGAGRVELRGLLVDEAQQAAVDAFARAAFVGTQVHAATRLDGSLPDGWPVRVLAGLESLSQLAEGSLLVRADQVVVRGVTGSQDARARITQILSSRLGQGQTFRVDVTYDEKLDPTAALPTPQECAMDVATAMAVKKITFTPGSAEITSDSAPTLTKLTEILRDCPAVRMEISGHTDSQGSESGNQALSQARAEAVLMALTGRRVDTSGMVAKGYGEADPIADNSTEEGREANRRIEFTLIAESGPAPAGTEPEPVAGAAVKAEDAGDPAAAEAQDGPVFEDEVGDEGAPMGAPEDDDAAAGAEEPDSVAADLPEAAPSAAAAVPAESAPAAEDATSAAEPAGAGAVAEAAAEQAAGPDFSGDTSPSVAPTEQTIRPQSRPAGAEAGE